jgi:hypothetical protein
MSRKDYDNSITEIQHDGVTDKWLVVRKILSGASEVIND